MNESPEHTDIWDTGLPEGSPEPGTVPPPPMRGAGQADPFFYRPPKEQNLNALLSLIFSLAGILHIVFSVVGVVLGFIALSQINKEPWRYDNKGMAIAGLAVGFGMIALQILLALFIIAILMAPFGGY